MITLLTVSVIAIHFIVGIVIFLSTDITPKDTTNIKWWKLCIVGGPGMLLPKAIGKLKAASFNWSLREWIIK